MQYEASGRFFPTVGRCGETEPVILVVDNYDSFVYNLARYFHRLGHTTRIIRNDAVDAEGLKQMAPSAVVFSPGPCAPQQAGHSLEIVRQLHTRLPMLGVCLGHQTIAEALGGRVIRAAEPVHGRKSLVYHDGRGSFAGAPNPFAAGRYHSLVVDTSQLPDELEVTARTDEGVIMGVRHRRYLVEGWQFHPESILTECGYLLLANFLRGAGLSVPACIPTSADELSEPAPAPFVPPAAPVTF